MADDNKPGATFSPAMSEFNSPAFEPADLSHVHDDIMKWAGALKDNILVPGKEKLQALGKNLIAEPLLSAAGVDTETPEVYRHGTGSVGERLARQALSSVGGEQVVSDMPPGERAEAEHHLRVHLGDFGAKLALGAADVAGQAPIWSALGPAESALGEAMPYLGKLGKWASAPAKGAAYGAAASAVDPNQSMLDGIVNGALANTAFHVGGKGLKFAGLATGKFMKGLWTDVVQAASKGLDFVKPREVESPSFAAIHYDPETRIPVATLARVDNKGGVQVQGKMPLDNAEALQAYKSLREKHGFPSLAADDNLMEHSETWKKFVFGESASGVINTPSGPHYAVDDRGHLRLAPVPRSKSLTEMPSVGDRVSIHKPGEAVKDGHVQSISPDGGVTIRPSPFAPPPALKSGSKGLFTVGDESSDYPTVNNSTGSATNSGVIKGRTHEVTAATPPARNIPLPHEYDAVATSTSANKQPGDITYPGTEADRMKRGFQGPGASGGGDTGDEFDEAESKLPTRVTPASEPGKTVPSINKLAKPVPPDVPSLAPGELDPHITEDAKLVTSYARAASGHSDKTQKNIMSGLLAPGMDQAMPIGQRQIILGARAAKHLPDVIANDVLGSIQSRGHKLNDEFDKEIEKYLLGHQNAAALEQYPQWQNVKTYWEGIARRIELNSKLKAALGGVADPLDTGEYENYLARSYFSRLGGSKKVFQQNVAPHKMADDDLMNAAAQHLLNRAKARGVNTDLKATGDFLRDLIMSDNPEDSFNSASAKDHTFLKPFASRSELLKGDAAKPLRELLGEVHSGALRAAQTIGKQEGGIAYLRQMKALSSDPKIFSRETQPGFEQLPDSPQFGRARGGWVQKDVHDAIVSTPNAQSSSMVQDFLRWLSSTRKQNLVALGGPGPLIHHSLANVGNSVIAGGLDPFHPVQSFQALRDAVESMKSYHENPIEAGPAELKQEAMKLGAVNPGFGGVEIDPAAKKMIRTISESMKQKGSGSLFDALGSIHDGYKSFTGKASSAYDSVNQTFQLANYLALRRKYLASGLSLDAARTKASIEVQQAFANYHNMAPVAAWAQKNIGVGFPMLTPMAEQARIYSQAVSRLRSGDKELAHRLLGFASGLASIFGAAKAIGHINGISSDEINTAKQRITPSQRDNYPVLAGIPWHDSQGRPQLIDLTHVIPFAHLLAGSSKNSAVQNITLNLMKDMSGPLFERQVDEYAAPLIGAQGKSDLHSRHAEGLVNGLVEKAKDLNRTGFLGPSVISKVADKARQAGAGSPPPRGPVATPGQAAAGFLSGSRIIPVNNYASATRDMASQLNATRRAMSNASSPVEAQKHEEALRVLQQRAQDTLQRYDSDVQSGLIPKHKWR